MSPDVIDKLTDEVDALIRKIDRYTAKAKHTFTVSHDDHTDDDGDLDAHPADGHYGSAGNHHYGRGDSDPTASDDAQDEADDEDDDNPGNDDEEDDDEEEDRSVKKALDGTDSETYWVTVNNAANRPGDLKHSTLSQPRHKFESLVDHVKNDQGVPKSEAMAIARQRYPDVYRAYQEFRQHTNNSSTSKRAPVTTFEDLVSAEMKKGVTAEIAAQRVMQAHGSAALRNRAITKRDYRALAAENELVAKADAIWSNSTLSRTEALREARLQRPSLFKRMQRV